MNKNEILNILVDWNFWEKDQDAGFIRPEYLKQFHTIKDSNHILVISGARRSGKSYLMRRFSKKLIEDGIKKENILFINFEDPRFYKLDSHLLQEIFETYLENLNPSGKTYIFLDEIQEVLNWEKWVSTMHELKKSKIIISGSNAKLLSQELSTLLTGRHLDLTVFPLSFKEFLIFKKTKIKNSLDLINKRIEIKRLLSEYFEYGSFPEVVLNENKKQILLTYFDDILNKDLIRRYKIRKTECIKELALYYLTNMSATSTYNSLKKQVLLTTDTIEKFSTYLESIYLVLFLKRFSFKIKEQEKSPRKNYIIDTGLANQVGFRFSQNLGKIVENIAYLELLRRKSTNPDLDFFYFKNERHQEVDFVIKQANKISSLIQMCWDIEDPKTKKRELNSLIIGLEKLNLKEGIIITDDKEDSEIYRDFKIKYIPLYKWLLTENLLVYQ